MGNEVLNCGLWDRRIWAWRGEMKRIREHATHISVIYVCYKISIQAGDYKI